MEVLRSASSAASYQQPPVQPQEDENPRYKEAPEQKEAPFYDSPDVLLKKREHYEPISFELMDAPQPYDQPNVRKNSSSKQRPNQIGQGEHKDSHNPPLHPPPPPPPKVNIPPPPPQVTPLPPPPQINIPPPPPQVTPPPPPPQINFPPPQIHIDTVADDCQSQDNVVKREHLGVQNSAERRRSRRMTDEQVELITEMIQPYVNVEEIENTYDSLSDVEDLYDSIIDDPNDSKPPVPPKPAKLNHRPGKPASEHTKKPKPKKRFRLQKRPSIGKHKLEAALHGYFHATARAIVVV